MLLKESIWNIQRCQLQWSDELRRFEFYSANNKNLEDLFFEIDCDCVLLQHHQSVLKNNELWLLKKRQRDIQSAMWRKEVRGSSVIWHGWLEAEEIRLAGKQTAFKMRWVLLSDADGHCSVLCNWREDYKTLLCLH